MNYIAEINAFNDWCEKHYLPRDSQFLWYKLIAKNNRLGWCEWMSVDNLELMGILGVKREATALEIRDKLLEAGLIEYIKGKKGVPNKYKIISLSNLKVNTAVNTVVNSEVNSEVNTAVNSEVNTVDINKQNKTKLNKTNIDMSKDISPAHYRERYTTEQLEVIDEFFNVLKHTRKSARIAENVILQIYKSWETHEAQKVLYALHKYVHTPSLHDKKENYVLGIIRNATAADIEQYRNQAKGKRNKVPQAPINRFCNYKGREWDYAKIQELELEYIENDLKNNENTVEDL